MSRNIKKETKVLWFGDLVVNSGFGRIGNEITRRLVQRGWNMIGASISWGGWPPHDLPFPLWGMGGQDIWNKITALAAQTQPDVIVCCQDYPYSQTLFHGCRIDWSRIKLIILTPIDGTPIHPEWVKMSRDFADATMVISKFGVEGLRQQGVQADLLQPGVDHNEFCPAEDGEKEAIREKLDIAPDAFVIGSFMMNQGRKMVSKTVEVFAEFAKDKPDAVLYLDMEKGSPAGWDIPSLANVLGFDRGRIKYREDAAAAGLESLRDRMIICDISSQMAHREGFGLPNIESQACKVPPTVLDWCSGPEIAGDGKGILIKRIQYMENGTWGNARDGFPNTLDWQRKWHKLYLHREKITPIALAGYEWAKTLTWDKASDQFEDVLKRVVKEQRKERAKYEPKEPEHVNRAAPGLGDVCGPAHVEYHSTDIQQSGEGLRVPGERCPIGQPGKD